MHPCVVSPCACHAFEMLHQLNCNCGDRTISSVRSRVCLERCSKHVQTQLSAVSTMPYGANSTLAPLLRVSAVTVGVVYGSWKLGSLRAHKAAVEQAALRQAQQGRS